MLQEDYLPNQSEDIPKQEHSMKQIILFQIICQNGNTRREKYHEAKLPWFSDVKQPLFFSLVADILNGSKFSLYCDVLLEKRSDWNGERRQTRFFECFGAGAWFGKYITGKIF